MTSDQKDIVDWSDMFTEERLKQYKKSLRIITGMYTEYNVASLGDFYFYLIDKDTPDAMLGDWHMLCLTPKEYGKIEECYYDQEFGTSLNAYFKEAEIVNLGEDQEAAFCIEGDYEDIKAKLIACGAIEWIFNPDEENNGLPK